MGFIKCQLNATMASRQRWEMVSTRAHKQQSQLGDSRFEVSPWGFGGLDLDLLLCDVCPLILGLFQVKINFKTIQPSR